jgi:hypothetical protein
MNLPLADGAQHRGPIVSRARVAGGRKRGPPGLAADDSPATARGGLAAAPAGEGVVTAVPAEAVPQVSEWDRGMDGAAVR